jgi:cobalt/nickel transport system permease protein
MHMADALISPAVGGATWAVAGGLIGYSARRMRHYLDAGQVPLMGVMGAFVFAAQMVNFSIPGTGSSGHLGGGLLLAILLGPPAAFITIASILTVQAMFFADGGLLALGCNIVNMGLMPCFIAYPLLYLPLAGKKPTRGLIALAATVAAVAGLQLGALGVVVETTTSGISDLPIGKFMLLMLPIHLAIGLVEGLVTTAVVTFIWQARPEVLDLADAAGGGRSLGPLSGRLRPVVISLLLAAIVTGGFVSWFASTNPDGLEWSIARTAGKEQLAESSDGFCGALRHVQERTAFLPDYDFAGKQEPSPQQAARPGDSPGTGKGQWFAPSAGATVSGLVGGGITLVLALLAGWALRRRATPTASA